MILSHIVAAAKNDVIGSHNTLPWDIPEDMQFFLDKTKHKALIMGRKTFESVGHPLPGRLNVVITRQKDYSPKGAIVVSTLAEAVEACKAQIPKYGEEIFIIGGGEIYRESLGIVDRVYLTRIHKEFPGDVTYPKLNEAEFQLVEQKDRSEPVPFSFLTYERKRK